MILGSTARLSSGMMQWGSRGPFRERGIGRFNRASGWWVAAFHKAARALPERLREGSGPFSEPPLERLPRASLQKRAERWCPRAALRRDRLRSPCGRLLAPTPAGTAGLERPEARTGAEAAVRHVQPAAGGLQAALQLLDLPADLLPLRLQLHGAGRRRGASGHGGGRSPNAPGPGRGRSGPAPLARQPIGVSAAVS